MITACFCADNNYKDLLEIAFYSFSKVNHGARVYILKYDDFDESILDSIAKDYSITLTTHLFYDEELPCAGRFSKAMYGRFRLYNIVKEEQFLYLDCDIIVNDSLRDLFKLNFNCIAMVKDIDSIITSSLKKRLSLKDYYNSGVILFKKCKETDAKINSTLNFLENNAGKLKYPDQDAINIVFSDDIFNLDSSYNYMLKDKCEYKPKIIHYAHYKPWACIPDGYYISRYREVVSNNPYGIKHFEKSYSYSDRVMAKAKKYLMKIGLFKLLQRAYWNYVQ